MSAFRWNCILLVSLLVLGNHTASQVLDEGESIPIDPRAAWHKRDELGCRSRARLTIIPEAVVVTGDTTGVLFWRVPTRSGKALTLEPTPKWIQECKRAPLEFGASLIDEARERRLLIDVGEYQRISWRWMIDRVIERRPGVPQERQTTVRLGLNIINRAGELREIAYAWSNGAPVDSVFVHRTSFAGGMVKRDWHRIVIRNSPRPVGEWVDESRDVRTDFKRLFPREEPGYIVRLYLRADGDQDGPVDASFANIVFSREP